MKEIMFKAWQKYHKVMLSVREISFDDKGVKSILVEYPDGWSPKFVRYEKNSKDFPLNDKYIDLIQVRSVMKVEK